VNFVQQARDRSEVARACVRHRMIMDRMRFGFTLRRWP